MKILKKRRGLRVRSQRNKKTGVPGRRGEINRIFFSYLAEKDSGSGGGEEENERPLNKVEPREML